MYILFNRIITMRWQKSNRKVRFFKKAQIMVILLENSHRHPIPKSLQLGCSCHNFDLAHFLLFNTVMQLWRMSTHGSLTFSFRALLQAQPSTGRAYGLYLASSECRQNKMHVLSSGKCWGSSFCNLTSMGESQSSLNSILVSRLFHTGQTSGSVGL